LTGCGGASDTGVMTLHVPELPFSLDPLMAEAKRRARQRRVLLGVAAVATVGAAVLAVQPWGRGRALGVAAKDTAIAQIPGMTRVVADGVAPWLRVGCTDPSRPAAQRRADGCRVPRVRAGRFEAWILTTAYEQGSRYNVSAAFASAHPGPVIVTDQWERLASARTAKQLLRNPYFNGSRRSPLTPAVNGGVAMYFGRFGFAEHGPPKQRARQTPTGRAIRFGWVSGPTVVSVTVIGAGLTAREARQIALLARPR
jgi:hypothetical protein